MSAWKRAFAACGIELAYWSGAAVLHGRRLGGLGVILKLERVKPRGSGRFQPLRSREITPEFLERMLRALRRWKFDVIPIDEVHQRLTQPAPHRRFVCLTFDGGYRDFLDHAYPVLCRHNAPFTVYIPSSFPDGLGELWWLALEQVIARNDRIGLAMDGAERRFICNSAAEKQQLFNILSTWFRNLPPVDRSVAVQDLCNRYGTDPMTISKTATMNWSELADIAANPLATIGSSTLDYSLLPALNEASAMREMKMGRAVLEAAIGRQSRHFAYPYGDDRSFGRREILLASQAGFATAVTTIPGVVTSGDSERLLALPRVTWDGRRRSLRALRVGLSGLMF